MTARILIVEDEAAIRELLAVNLRHAGYVVTQADSAESARQQLEAALPDLVLLDWMLPGQSGVEFAKQLRATPRTRELPIMLLTARAQEGDKLQGFEVGADDYVTKPFSPRELLARVRALLRRAAPDSLDEPVEIGGLRLEPDTFRVFAGDQPISLSPTEFKLLHYFMKHADRVLSRTKLLDNVWGDHVYIEERTVDVHIRRLRLALGPSGHDRLIETVRGGGYRFLPR
ncbi:MAG: phosphate regulon transcriptional regulator PhoB [Burkholderiales bacterium]|nr:phosphate regulon transcriptional regulator PhoB [Burkholderiales bacterium]ODU63050.1 MAG: phosphate regulon transcriptional regulatory protein PhoB [Lautropia sp. SCN 66-9]